MDQSRSAFKALPQLAVRGGGGRDGCKVGGRGDTSQECRGRTVAGIREEWIVTSLQSCFYKETCISEHLLSDRG